MKKITIQEIAKELGLSRNTVSKALANSETVAEETRYAIVKKAYEMGYAKLKTPLPKELVNDYQHNSMRTIMVLGRDASSFWNKIIMGISEELSRNNCRLHLSFVAAEDEMKLRLPKELTNGEVHGVIVLSVMEQKYVEKVAACGLPIVFLDAPCATDAFSKYGDIVLPESMNSVRRMTESLIAQGMRRMAFIGDTTYCKSIMDRFQGFVWALWEAGLDMDKNIIRVSHQPAKYYEKAEVEGAINSMPYIPDAIVCANDDIAKDVYIVLKQKGILVPRDVAVIGFDDKEEAEIMSPSLTTVHIPNQSLGIRLVQQLLWRMDHGKHPKETVYVNTEVVFRESSIRNRL